MSTGYSTDSWLDQDFESETPKSVPGDSQIIMQRVPTGLSKMLSVGALSC